MLNTKVRNSGESPETAQLVAGLSLAQATIDPKYFYNPLGSALFVAICHLEAYYPTRVERSIFESNRSEIAAAIGPGTVLIDLGAGDCAKAAWWFEALQPCRYLAVDISIEFVNRQLGILRTRFPHLPMLGLEVDFTKEWALPETVSALIDKEKQTYFYPGSSIGNFDPTTARDFLSSIRRAKMHADGQLLIGVDFVKPSALLETAYDDPVGVTAAFNRNMLDHVNTVLGSNFDPRQWLHKALFNAEKSRIEMYLTAADDIDVAWPEGGRSFSRGESIHTENSYKYTRESFSKLLADAGFHDIRCWTDSQSWFGVFLAQA